MMAHPVDMSAHPGVRMGHGVDRPEGRCPENRKSDTAAPVVVRASSRSH